MASPLSCSVGVLAEIQVAGSQAPCKRPPGMARPRARYSPRGYPGPIRIGTHNRKPNSEISISHDLALAQSSDFCSALPDELTEHLTGPRQCRAVPFGGAQPRVDASRGRKQRRVVATRLGHSSLPKTLAVSIQPEGLLPSSSFMYLQITPRMCTASGL